MFNVLSAKMKLATTSMEEDTSAVVESSSPYLKESKLMGNLVKKKG